jgi:hypothetical protein
MIFSILCTQKLLTPSSTNESSEVGSAHETFVANQTIINRATREYGKDYGKEVRMLEVIRVVE